MMRNDTLLAMFGPGTALIGIFTLHAVSAVGRQLKNRNINQEIYEDDDGRATPESMKAFSAARSKVAILSFAATGLAISLLLVLMTQRGPDVTLENLVLIAGSWVSDSYLTKGLKD